MIGLRYIMELEGITTKELAEFLEVSSQAINQWEKKQRAIPKERLDKLRQRFPFYPVLYFSKEIDEREAIMLQNAKIKHDLELLKGKDDFQSVRARRILVQKRDENERHLEQQVTINKVKSVLEKSAELRKNVDGGVLISQNVFEDFSRLCSLEEKIITGLMLIDEDESNHAQVAAELQSEIKLFIDEMKDHVNSIKYMCRYNKKNLK